MTSTRQDPHAVLRARLAATPLPEPGPERVRRWQAALDCPVAAAGALAADHVAEAEPARTAAGTRPAGAGTPRTGAGSWVSGAGPWVSGAGSWVFGAGPWVFGAGSWVSGAGSRFVRWTGGATAAWGAGLAAAAAATALALAGPAPAEPGPEPGARTLGRVELPAHTPTGRDFGPLADPAVRARCLAAHGIDRPALAGQPVVVDGRPGVLLVLPTEQPGRLRLLVVDPTCEQILADDTRLG